MLENLANLDKYRYVSGTEKTADVRLEMQMAMQKHAAVFRNEEIMKEGFYTFFFFVLNKKLTLQKKLLKSLKKYGKDY